MNNNIFLLVLPMLLNGFKDSSEDSDENDLNLDEEWYDLWWVWVLFGFGTIFLVGLLIWSIRHYRINRIVQQPEEQPVEEDNQV